MTELKRWSWLAICVVGAALLVGLAFYFDSAAAEWIASHQSRPLKLCMRAVSRFGDWPEHILIGAVLLGVAYARGSKRWLRIFAAMILACALAGAVARVIKIGTGRARPSAQAEAGWNGPRFSSKYNAFPSGHTAASTAFFAALAFASWRVGAAFLIVPVVIACSRMYVAAHYLSDVVCAALIGIICAALALRLLRERADQLAAHR